MVADTISLLLFPALMAFAASSDLITMTISNRISLLLIAGFFVLAVMTGMPLIEIGMHVGASAAVLVVAFVFFARGWIGGGDAKLAAATAMWFGFDQLPNYLVVASLYGGILTIAILRFRTMPLPAALANQEWAQRLHRMDTGIPYGIALALAALMIYPDTPWMKSLGMGLPPKQASAPRSSAGAMTLARKIDAQESVNSNSIRAINHGLTVQW
jgi:prepilin peptidase CpaA